MVDLINQSVKEFLFFFLLSFRFWGGNWYWSSKTSSFGFLTILGLVGFDWLEEVDDDEFSFGCKGNGEGVDERWVGSCEDRQGLCGLVASEGSRHTGNGCSPLGSGLCGNRRGRVILQMWHSRERGGRVLGGRGTHQDDGKCLQDQFPVHR